MNIQEEIREYVELLITETNDLTCLSADIIFIKILNRFDIFATECLEWIYDIIDEVGKANGLNL